MTEETFKEYLDNNMKYVVRVKGLLSTEIHEDLGIMDADARELVGHGPTVSSMANKAEGYLRLAEYRENTRLVRSTSEEWESTAGDRAIALAAAVVKERWFRDEMRSICKAISDRISYAQSRLKAFAHLEVGQK